MAAAKNRSSPAISKLGVRGEEVALAEVPGELGHAFSAASTPASRGKSFPGNRAATGEGRPCPCPGAGGGTFPSPTLSSTETTSALITATSGKFGKWALWKM